jgi:hypothetical protein
MKPFPNILYTIFSVQIGFILHFLLNSTQLILHDSPGTNQSKFGFGFTHSIPLIDISSIFPLVVLAVHALVTML